MFEAFAIVLLLQTQPVPMTGPARVESGQVLIVAGRPVRLWGVEPFSGERDCDVYAASEGGCDRQARDILEEQIVGARESRLLLADQNQPRFKDVDDVRCVILGEEAGVRLGRCEILIPACYGVACEEVWYDLSEELISAGVVRQRRTESAGVYDEAERSACGASLGGWSDGCEPAEPS